MTAKRDQFGRLGVDDDTLAAHAVGCFLATCLSTEAIAARFGCDEFEATAFKENAHADLGRIRMMRGRA